MAYSVNELITNAFYLSKVRSRDFQTVSGSDVTIGLDLFNKVLAGTASNTRMIPYYSEYSLNAVIGQEKYFIPNLVEPFSLTFNMTPVRFATTKLSRRQFHSTTRINNIIALPFDVTFERAYNVNIGAVAVVVAGSGYAIGDILTLVGGNNDATLTVTALSGTAVAAVNVSNPGTGYSNNTTYGVTGGTGSSATFAVTLGNDGCNMSVQYLPNETYPFRVWGKFALSPVTVAQLPMDLTTVYALWYIDYLEHWVAKRICNYYGVAINPEVQAMIDNISSNINDCNVIDLTSEKINLYCNRGQPNWITLQLSHGFEPGY